MFRYRKGKYNNRKVTIDGITFDSAKEGDYYCQLKMLRMAGQIKDFERQVPYELQPKFKHEGKTIRAIKYIADFVVIYPDGSEEVIDVKGEPTDVYLLKRKMLLYHYPDINFKEV